MPLKKMTVFALKPKISGTKTVAPNIAITCWMPRRIVCGHGSRSSG